jgi:hypothetical protein
LAVADRRGGHGGEWDGCPGRGRRSNRQLLRQRHPRNEGREGTINGAYAAFEEDIKGSLTPGKLADITVLSRDIMTIPEEEIPDTEVASSEGK